MAEPFTPDWWLQRLITNLERRQHRYELLDSYVRSEPPLPPMPNNKGKTNTAFEFLRRISRVNWADIIVESVVERMKVLNFASGDSDLDAGLRQVWTVNGLDISESQLYRTKAALSEAYAIVGSPDDTLGGVPRVTFEDPRQMIAEVDPVDKQTVLAALKVMLDDVNNVDRAFLYLPGEGEAKATVQRAERPRKKDQTGFQFTADGWVWDDQGPRPLATMSAPVVWYPNRADLTGRTMGEFEHVKDDLDRIILMVLQRVQVAVLQAFRQRAVKGSLPEKDAQGNVIDYNVLFSSDPGALWNLPNGVELWESAGVDLTPILESVKGDVRDLAGRTRTPLYYFYPNEGGSAEGAVTQREGLIFRATARTAETSGPHRRLMQLVQEAQGREQIVPVMPVWLRPDLATLAERYDAAAKAKAAGVPWRTIMIDILQFTPEQVDQMAADQAPADQQIADPPAPAAV